MRHVWAAGILLGVIALPAHAQVCVSAVKVNSSDRGLVLPPPGHADFGKTPATRYTVQIDDGPRTAVSSASGTLIAVAAQHSPHVFQVYRDDQRVHSFNFSLSGANKKTCVTFTPLYETWSLASANSFQDCGCEPAP